MGESEPPSLQPGRRFRGLLVQSVLGKGAMGAAYLVSHPILRMPLVVKTFRETGPGIFKEAHLAARVVSPNVVGVLDAGTEEGIPFVVQRYVDGIDLAELLARVELARLPLATDAICRILVDAARGLHAIHQAGVVHRDVKPANLFLSGAGVTMVGDFGIAVDPVKNQVDAMLVGTPMFMAPEQWNNEPLDRRTDVYALGATAHLLATGRHPFDAPNLVELGIAHINRPYAPPPADGPREAYLLSCVERMLRKDPADRYPTAEAVARTLAVVAEPPPEFVPLDVDSASVGPVRVELAVGDLAEAEVDVIVNAANWQLTMEVGVAAALSAAAGPSLAREACSHAPAAMGDVVWTAAGDLRARWVAHAVAALAGGVCLQRCTLRVLLEAEARGAQAVAFPALGTGVGDVPMDLAAQLMLEATRTFASLRPRSARLVRVVLFDEAAAARWRAILRSIC